jgi:hypothetical protein
LLKSKYVFIVFYLQEACSFLLTLQGQCKPNAESLLFAEVQPVLAMSSAKLGIKKSIPLQCNRMPMICQRFANVLPKML